VSYSTAYQTVTAGRVREDEAIGFFGDNKVATPARVTNFKTTASAKQPVLSTDHLNHVGRGKAGTTSDNIGAYKADTVNIS